MTENEIEPRMEPGVEVSKLAQWALDARQAHLVAESLARTSFVPEAMKGKPGEITAAILTGAEIGLEPMSALRSIDVINGTPAMRAHALRGLVQSRGHTVWVEESCDTRAIVCGQRRGDENVQRSVWTLDRAKKMDLTGKSNWRRMPQAMLVARATSELCRLIASDVMLGMPYSTEELADETPDERTPTMSARSKRTARRKPLPTVEPTAPALEPAAEPAEPETGRAEEPALEDDTDDRAVDLAEIEAENAAEPGGVDENLFGGEPS
ncbi:hypothetical protein [Sciscionella sediminilitoris]|uniref:hypothetical protein n=1 Tax=Sciscionella sediminilitoris TaxID=1445613 RepID=UPI0004DF37AA|nr:hypothetical protein [Sciscionella sp. SE31]